MAGETVPGTAAVKGGLRTAWGLVTNPKVLLATAAVGIACIFAAPAAMGAAISGIGGASGVTGTAAAVGGVGKTAATQGLPALWGKATGLWASITGKGAATLAAAPVVPPVDPISSIVTGGPT